MVQTNWTEFVNQWIDRARNDERLRIISHDVDVAFCVKFDENRVLVHVHDGSVVDYDVNPSINKSWSFTLTAPSAVWNKYLEAVPEPIYHDLLSMIARVPDCQLEGDRKAFARNAHVLRRFMELGRETQSGPSKTDLVRTSRTGIEPITGRFLNMNVEGTNYRIYFEESGQGPDLLFLHTAGSDSRQFYHLMNDPRLTENYHMIAFDMPLHGKSLPPAGYVPGSYKLTTDFYISVISEFIRSLQLKKPIVLGSSMAGEICLELAYRFPDELGGVVACEASDKIEGRLVEWVRSPEVNETLFVPEWIHGLMGPQTPATMKEEILWEYAQGGHAVFYGDICFYSGDWDGRDRVSKIDTGRCPVYMLTGEYDFSCTPEMSERTAAKIPGSKFQKMKGIGHFPMAENPDLFLEYVIPVLKELVNHKGESR